MAPWDRPHRGSAYRTTFRHPYCSVTTLEGELLGVVVIQVRAIVSFCPRLLLNHIAVGNVAEAIFATPKPSPSTVALV